MPNVNEKITFGLELEGLVATPASATYISKFTKRFDHSIVRDDGSPLPRTLEEGGGFEFITRPLVADVSMSNTGENLTVTYPDGGDTDVMQLCDCVAHVNRSCGVHVHLGRPSRDNFLMSKWEPERVRTMLAIGLMIEDKVFDVVPNSRRNTRHCAVIRSRYSDSDLTAFYPTGNVVARKYDNPKRYCWLNLIETRRVGTETRPGRGASVSAGTIEIRALGHTRDAAYIWAWTKLWIKVAAYVAYLPSSLAVMRTMVDLEADFRALAKFKWTHQESTAVTAVTAVSEPPRARSRREVPVAPVEVSTPTDQAFLAAQSQIE